MRVCIWGCGHVYEEFDQKIEMEHLLDCLGFQNAPIAEINNGVVFVNVPNCPNLFVERFSRQN